MFVILRQKNNCLVCAGRKHNKSSKGRVTGRGRWGKAALNGARKQAFGAYESILNFRAYQQK